jgi:hypothetical protein
VRNLLIGSSILLCASLGSSACSSDGAADAGAWGDESSGAGGDDSDGLTGDGTEPGESGGETGDSGENDSGGATTSGDTGSGEDGGDFDPCDGVDCGEDGECLSDGEEAWCECGEGFWPEGEGCVPCAPLSDVTALQLTTYEVTASWTLNSDTPPSAIYEEAQFWLENRSTGDRVDFGKSWEGDLGARVLPGAYDLVYSYVSGDELPAHSHYVVQTVIVRDNVDLAFNLLPLPISGEIRINGELPPTVQYDDGQIVFVNPGTGDEIAAGNTRDGAYTVAAFPGVYDVHYRVEDAGDMVPANADAKVTTATVSLENEVLVANVELTTTQLSGDILVNGVAPPAVQYDDGNVYLRTSSGDEIHLGSTRDGSYSVVALVGDYEFEYELEDGGQDVPANIRARVSSMQVTETTTQTFHADVPRVEYSGSFTLNGAAAPSSQYDDGTIRLRNQEGGGEVYLGNTHDGSFSVGVIPGQYDVVYAVDSAGGQMPMNLDSTLSTVSISADASTVVDVQAVTLSGGFTVDGALPPESEYEDGRLYLRSSVGNDAVLLGYTHDGSYATVVTPGDYEVFFTHEFGSGVVPDNSNGMLMPLSVQAPLSFDVDVPVVALAGSFELDGEVTPNVYSDAGQLFLRRRSDGDSISLGSTQAGSYQVAVTPGTYEVFYARSENVAMMPRNENARVSCFVVE